MKLRNETPVLHAHFYGWPFMTITTGTGRPELFPGRDMDFSQ